MSISLLLVVFFFNDTATTEIYTLSLHDALPIFDVDVELRRLRAAAAAIVDRLLAADADLGAVARRRRGCHELRVRDRKSTRLNSSHANISYAVFCLKKKKKII